MLISPAPTPVNPTAALLTGYGVTILALALMVLVLVSLFRKLSVRPKPQAPVPVTEPPLRPGAAPGSAGRIKLYDTPDREAAMIMAIVADKMGKPLNELRFISIREVK